MRSGSPKAKRLLNTDRSRDGAEESSLARLPVESRGRFPALRLVVIYAFFGALWILVSDRLSFYLVPDLQRAEWVQTYKGWFFIAATSLLLWLLVKRFLSQVRAAEGELHRLNRKLQAISNCNQMLLRATDEQSLLEGICRIVCEEAGYRMAWVGYAENDEAKSVRPVAWAGTEERYLANLGITWADTERGSGPTGMAIRSGKSCCIQDFATDPRLAVWRESVLQQGYRSGSALPLKDEHGNAFGSLTIYCAQPNAFTPEETRLLEELAGNMAFGIVTLRSGAARKRAEDALRDSEANLNRAQQVAHIGSWHLDIAQNQLTWSDEVYRIFDKPRGTALSYESFLSAIHPEDRERLDRAWAAALQGAHYDIEHRILVGYELKWVRNRAEVEFDLQGKAVHGIGTVQDITERKRAEEERERLRHLEADLRHLNRVSMMGGLAASIAHEVNQPIAGIVNNGSACLRWLAGDVPNVEEAREAVRHIVRDGKRAGEIIARIRALATKRAATNKEELDLNRTIQEVLALLGDEAKKKSVIIRSEFADDIPPVSGDRVQLQQVVLNLVMNAIEAMSGAEERAQELVVSTRNTDAAQVLVTVEDSGPGIDPRMIDKIFDSFYSSKPGGMGMGLSISRSIVQAHGGRLWATANDGPGTTFHFTLPKHNEEEARATVSTVATVS